MEKLNRVFDQVALSREREDALLADLLNEKREVSSMKQNRKHRLPAAALVAAVLVVALAGTAVAERYSGRMDVSPKDGNYENGYEVTGAYQNIPPERLSEELLERAAQIGAGDDELVFGSWSEAEEFLGLEVADNSMLDEMAQSEWIPPHAGDASPEDLQRCDVRINYSKGSPDVIWMRADYFGDYFAEGPFGVSVDAFMRTKAANGKDLPFTLGSSNIENVSEEKYVTPSGIEVTIFTQDGTARTLDGGSFQQSSYFAYFTMNNAVFRVYTNFNAGNAEDAMRLLKQVLDAYE